MEKQKKRFLYAAAICSCIGALTTTLLMTLPNPEAATFQSQVLLYNNTQYLVKLWVLYIHPQVNFLAILGIAFLLFKKYPLQIAFGSMFLCVWAYTEMSQQAMLIDALNQIWRPGYLEANNQETQNMYKTLIKAANGVSDSNYFLVLYGFGIGSFLYGLAFIHENGLGKWIGISLLFIGVLSIASFIRYYLGIKGIGSVVNWTYKYIYAYLQPLVRIAVGFWIFMKIKKS